MTNYLKFEKIKNLPRIPLSGSMDITYGCNNNCRHCWVNIPAGSPERQKELGLDEIREIVDEARKMGCRKWYISGGEPMLRPDFAEIFDTITYRSAHYSLNTNGTLITPEIARLLKRKGSKMVVLYGATADVHDHITRNPGSFEAAMQGIAYLRGSGAGFTVQIIPMRDNYHQFHDMVSLAQSLSPHWRIGASWLYLSACGDPKKNQEIIRQRLEPADIIQLETPDPSYDDWTEDEDDDHRYSPLSEDDRLLDCCIQTRRDFHIDPYGQMTFCSYIKDPDLRYDLKKGNFTECWEDFIPSLSARVKGGREFLENCGSCELRKACRWCPAYGYLEHRQFNAKVEYLCAVARENRRFKDEWIKNHRRYYHIAGITIQVDSDLPIAETTYHPKLKPFEADGHGEDTIFIRHHFTLPDPESLDLGEMIYETQPWAIYRKGDSWTYVIFNKTLGETQIYRVAIFNHDYTRARIFSPNEDQFRKGHLHSLSLLPTDQFFLTHVLAHRDGCFMHASGVILEGKGLLFVGHSDAGKSTMVKILKDEAEILCDDRMVIRRWPEGFRIHGTWSHGEIPDVSVNSAPLKAILFLEKVQENPSIIPVENRREITGQLLACMIKPFVTAEWWEKMLALVEKMVREIPFYRLYSDRSDGVMDLLRSL